MSDKPTPIELRSTSEVPAGAVMAFVCRSISLRAGAYAPGIHEHVFRTLDRREFGVHVDHVARWFDASAAELHRLGYRIGARRIAFRTPAILSWVEHGGGFRGAVLTTDGSRLHDRMKEDQPHAVGLTAAPEGQNEGQKKKKSAAAISLADPWPGVEHHSAPNGQLEPAHRLRKYAAVLVYWTGYS